MKRITFAIAVVLAVAAAAPMRAQAPGLKWKGWLGCWTSAPAGAAIDQSPIVCITPTADGDVVEMSVVASGKVLTRDRIDASGRPQTIEATSCNGTTRANWSGDQRRVFLTSAVTCEGLPSETWAMLSISANGEWLDVRKVAAGGGANTHVTRYRDVGIPSVVPVDIADVLVGRNMAIQSARAATSSPVGTSAVIEASRMMDSSVVEAWVVASEQTFELGPRVLRELADAGVPENVTEAMIAASNPGHRANERYARYVRQPYAWPAYDPWAYGYYRPFGRGYYDWAPYGYRYARVGYLYLPYAAGYVPRIYGWGPQFYEGVSYGDVSVAAGVGAGYGWGGGYAPYGFGPYGPLGYGYARRSPVGYVYVPTVVLHQGQGGGTGATSTLGKGYSDDDGDRAGKDGKSARPKDPNSGSGSSVTEKIAGAAAATAAALGGRTAKGRP
ncbi:MAG: hypothetical protein JWM95_2120 [Gemmatimonadetes bacterium]|nr:hypothetical protein [Gemmatimonadota bacterium]